MKGGDPVQKKMEEVAVYIQQHVHDGLCLEDLARQFHYSPYHLCQYPADSVAARLRSPLCRSGGQPFLGGHLAAEGVAGRYLYLPLFPNQTLAHCPHPHLHFTVDRDKSESRKSS